MPNQQKKAVAVVSAPWIVLPTKEDADINEVRQRASVETCRDNGIDTLVICGRDEEVERLTLCNLYARRQARYRVKDLHVLGGSYCTFLNGFRALEFAHTTGVTDLTLVTSPWHMARLRYVFEGIAHYAAHYLSYTIALNFHESAWSSDPATLAFEHRLAVEEPGKLVHNERRVLERYRWQLSRWTPPIGKIYLPFPEVVLDVPPPTLARLASIVTP